jgi:hypothetical protein
MDIVGGGNNGLYLESVVVDVGVWIFPELSRKLNLITNV